MSSDLFLCDGFISVNPVSGTGPYSYTWSNGHNSSLNLNLCDTSYTYTVIDANGCGFTETIILTTYLGCTDSLVKLRSNCYSWWFKLYYSIPGCTDPQYMNYDPNSNFDDGSCI